MRFATYVFSCTWAIAAVGAIDSATLAQSPPPSAVERRPPDVDRIGWHISDPEGAMAYLQSQMDKIDNESDRKFAQSVIDRLNRLVRPERVRLTLADAVQRTVANSYAIRIQSYAPAISTAAAVQAEAAFDAVFFANMTKNTQDAPAPTQLVGTKTDSFSLNGGIRKLLPLGGQASASMSLRRIESNNQFQSLNPVYTAAFVAELAQPLLRGAGLDYNRSQIHIAQNDASINRQAFMRQVRDTLFAVERAYWQLVQARREATIRARLLAEFEKTYDYLWQRKDFDIYQIQLSQTKANLETSRADYIRVVNQVHGAEDTLRALMNDPAINLTDEVEIIPVDFPTSGAVTLDRLGVIQAALENRSEIAEARLQIENAGLRVGQTVNQALPKLDLVFRYTVDGLGSNAHFAVNQVTQSDFIEYFVFLDAEVPIGNRQRKAALREARLQHAQAIAALKNQIEQVILDSNTTLRAIQTAYDRIEPSLQSAEANEDQVASVIARAERKDFSALNQELNARNSLADSRSALLADLVQYNIALIDLERAKGTLLTFNNIVVSDGKGD